jgi:hypothetical protein
MRVLTEQSPTAENCRYSSLRLGSELKIPHRKEKDIYRKVTKGLGLGELLCSNLNNAKLKQNFDCEKPLHIRDTE